MNFSIIIPVYNVEKYLRECLESVLNQSFRGDYEVICVNDGSTDGSLAVLLEYADKYSNLNVIDSENGGTASARNIGIGEAKGEYIWFVDSDDWVETNSLQVLSEHVSQSQPDVLCFNGKLCYEEDGREEQDEGITENMLSGWEYYNKYALVGRKFHFVCVVLRLYKTEFIRKNSLWFDTSVTHEDNLWIPQMMYYAESVHSIPENLYYYRIREGSKMQNQNPQRIFDIVTVANKLSAFFIPLTGIDKGTVYREIAGEYFKGFMPEEQMRYGKNDRELIKQINWNYFRAVSQYPRHKRIFHLISVHPIVFRLYLKVEELLKKVN